MPSATFCHNTLQFNSCSLTMINYAELQMNRLPCQQLQLLNSYIQKFSQRKFKYIVHLVCACFFLNMYTVCAECRCLQSVKSRRTGPTNVAEFETSRLSKRICLKNKVMSDQGRYQPLVYTHSCTHSNTNKTKHHMA